MISYLPEIYPDELVYSWFCRYYVHSGCLTHKSALDEILHSRHNNPSKEFLGKLSDEMLTAIQRVYPIEDLILEHTMYPQYARYIPLSEKKKALYHIAYDFCDAHHLFAILPRSEEDAYLKYCPLCAREDRQMHGEAYWHRIHQLRNMQICTKHNCRLEKSNVIAKSEGTFTLCPAEMHIEDKAPVLENNTDAIAYARFVTDVFTANMELTKDIPISTVFYNAMKSTWYLKSSGKSRYTKQLAADLNQYFQGLGLPEIASMYQIQRVLLGDRYDFSVVNQIAYFLKMGVTELTAPQFTEAQIAEERSSHYMKDRQPIDWAVYDKETAPVLERVARSIYDGSANESGRPERVSEKIIYRELGFPGHRLENLPLCQAVFSKYNESYEENWARRIIWAYEKLTRENKPFYWSDIRKLTGVKKINLEKVIPYIKKHTDRKTAKGVMRLIE